jgi:Transposase IS116/IS110/IS902 family
MHDMHPFPREQDFVLYAHLIPSAQSSAGKRSGPSGKNIGKASRKRASSEAARRVIRVRPSSGGHVASGLFFKQGTWEP